MQHFNSAAQEEVMAFIRIKQILCLLHSSGWV